MSNSDERSNTLWKTSLGFPTTNKNKPFYLETELFNNSVDGKDLLLDPIPNVFTAGENGNQHILEDKTTTISSIIDVTGIVEKFENLPLQLIFDSNTDGTTPQEPGSGAWYCKDEHGNNLLTDALQFNYNKSNEGVQPYRYILKLNGDKITMDKGNWVFFVKPGIIKFFGSHGGIDANSNLTLTFWKYIGRKGISNKQDNLTFDPPSSNSANPSTSAQIKTALDGINTQIQEVIDNNLINKYLSKQPSKFVTGVITSDVDKIILNWSPGDTETITLSISGQTLPIIDNIRIDIKNHDEDDSNYRSVMNGNSANWPNNKTSIEFRITQSYGSVGKIDTDSKVIVRVYGVNKCNDDPSVSERALVFGTLDEPLKFTSAAKPSAPIFVRNQSTNNNSIITNWKVESIPTPLVLEKYRVHYQAVATHRIGGLDAAGLTEISTTLVEDTTESNFSSKPNTNGASFPVTTSTNLFPGTSYKVKCQVKNNSNVEYSDFSNLMDTAVFTQFPPQSDKQHSAINLAASNLTPSTFYNGKTQLSSKYYFSNNSLLLDMNNNLQQFEITDPSVLVGNTRIGSRIADQDQALWELRVTTTTTPAGTIDEIDTVSSQSFSMNGPVAPGDDNNIANFIQNTGVIESLEGINRGFRKDATFSLINIDHNHFSANNRVQQLRYDLINLEDNSTRNTQPFDLYIDNLSGSPTASLADPDDESLNFAIQDVTSLETCGIKSVKTFSVQYPKSVQTTNINSEFGYRSPTLCTIIYSNTNIGGLSTETFSSSSTDLETDGEYEFAPSNKQNLYFINANTNSANRAITMTIQSKNLIGNSPEVTKTFQVSGHYDKDSYNLSHNKIDSQKCPQFYELTLNTDVTTITSSSDISSCDLYNTHSTLVKNHTPVFYGGRFCSKDTIPSPYRKFEDPLNVGTTDYETNHKNVETKFIAFDVPTRTSSSVTSIYNNKTLRLTSYAAYVYFQDAGGTPRLGTLYKDGENKIFDGLSAYYKDGKDGLGAMNTDSTIELPYDSQNTTSNMKIIFEFTEGFIN